MRLIYIEPKNFLNMKFIKFTLLAALCVLLPSTANAIKITPSKNYVTQNVDLPIFNAIETMSSIDIEYSQGNQDVKIYAPDNLIKYIEVKVVNGSLRVKYNVNNMQISGKNDTKIIVSAPAVNKFKTHASGDITIKTPIKLNNDISFTTNASGDIKAEDINGKRLTLATRGSGDIKAKNITGTYVMLQTNGSGDVEVTKLNAPTIECLTNASGDISIDNGIVTETISLITNGSGDIDAKNTKATDVKCSTNASGDIFVSGSCTNVDLTTNGAGDISAKNLNSRNFSARTNGSGDINGKRWKKR